MDETSLYVCCIYNLFSDTLSNRELMPNFQITIKIHVISTLTASAIIAQPGPYSYSINASLLHEAVAQEGHD